MSTPTRLLVTLAVVLPASTLGAEEPTPGGLLRPRAVLTAPGQAAVTAFAFAPDGTRLAAGTGRGLVHFWDLRAGRWLPARLEPLHLDQDVTVRQLAWSPDGSRLGAAVGGGLGTFHVWDVATGRLVWRTAGVRHPADVTFAPDGKRVALLDARAAQLYDAANGELLHLWPLGGGTRACLGFSGGGRTLVLGEYGAGVLRLLDVRTGRERGKLEVPGVSALACSPRGDEAAVANLGSYLALRDLKTGKVWGRVPGGSNNTVRALALSRDGRHLVSGDDGGTITVWDFRTGKPLARFGAPQGDAFLDLSPDGRRLATTTEEGGVGLWDLTAVLGRAE